MSRKLKTYVTSVGFFDKAIAAPSMKAALEAWGANKNTFQQGFAEETDDPAIIAATMAKPGVVLKRAVGTQLPFTEDAELPDVLPSKTPKRAPKPKLVKKRRTKTRKPAEIVSFADRRAEKEVAADYEREQTKRKHKEKKEEAAKQKERERRNEAIRKAEALLEKAQRRHAATAERLEAERSAIDDRLDDENARWESEKKKLDSDIRGTPK